MTQSKHTAGPWKIDPFTGYKTQIYGDKKHIAVALAQSSEKFRVTIAEAEANARLIASAPKLLQAAKIADTLIKLIEKWADSDQEESYAIMDDIVALAQGERGPEQAITEATGG